MALVLGGVSALLVAGCPGSAPTTNGNSNGRASDAQRRFPLDNLQTGTVTINDQTIRVWLAVTSTEQNEGLMYVPENEIADDQGMLFVFPDEAQRGFWMRNTITPLDIAFARMNGDIVKIWQMPPLTLETFPSIEPAMFALEMKQGSFARLGIKEGDRIVIPAEVSNLPR